MAGVREDLILDISQAQRAIDQLEAQVAGALSTFAVTVDTRSIVPEIEASIRAAATEVAITGDAAELTGEITGAIDAADTNVVVTGDAGALQGSVQDALSARSFGPVNVDGDLSPQLLTDTANLGANLADASDEGRALNRVLAAISVGGAALAVKSLVDAASDLGESTSKARRVFGEEFTAIDTFAAGAAESVGLSSQAALEATGTFGNLFQALGTSRSAAAELSPEVVQLAADLASFNNLEVDEALEKLRSGLIGEVEPLRALGVSFLDVDVKAKAAELGLGGVGRELTEGEKVLARYQLITEQTALAQDDFARTSDGLANQQRIFRAEAEDAAAAAGVHLLPAFQALVDEGREVLPVLSDMGDDILPAVSDAIENLAPLLGTTVDILTLAAPLIEVTAEGLAMIPPEAIAIGSSLVIANKGLGALFSLTSGVGGALQAVPAILDRTAQAVPRTTSGVGALAGGVTGLAQSVANLNPVTVSAGLLAAGLFANWQNAREEARRFAAEVDELTGALETVDGMQQLTTTGLSRYIRELSELKAKDQIDELGELGITISQVSYFVQQGPAGLDKFIESLVAAGDATKVYRNEFGELVDAQGNVIDANSDLADSLLDVGGQLLVGNTDIVTSYQDIAAVTEEAARRQISLLQAQGLVSEEQVRFALGMNDSGEATRTYAEALNDLEPQVTAAARAQQIAQVEYDRIKATYLDTAAAAETLGKEAPEVNKAITGLATGATSGDRAFLNLALAIDRAALSEEGMQAAASLLGTDVESLQGFVDQATGAIDQFVESAASGLPTISGTLSDIRSTLQESENELASAQERDARTVTVSTSQFADGLRAQAQALGDFRSDLQALSDAGFSDVAGLLAEQGFEAGSSFADELAAALQDGNTEIVENLRDANQAFQVETTSTLDYLRNVLGPELILTSGLIGEGAAQALFDEADFEDRIRIKGALADAGLDEAGQVIATTAALKGEQAAREFGRLMQLDEEAIDAAIAAGVAIELHAPVAAAADAGARVGAFFLGGLIAGLRDPEQLAEIERALREAAQRGVIAVEDQLGISSPSRVAMRIGAHFVEGLVLGVSDRGALARPMAALGTEMADGLAAAVPTVASAVPAFGTRDLAPAGSARRMHPEDITALAEAIGAAVPPGGDTWQITEAGSARDTARAVFARGRARDRRGSR